MVRFTALSVASLVTLAGCADPPGADPSGVGGKADGSLTTLTFAADFTHGADGPVVAGSSVRVAYDLDRLTACRGSTNGSDVWGITGWARFDGGSPRGFSLSRLSSGHTVPVSAELALPAAAKRVELWFTNSNAWGCNAFDSNMGSNYAFDLAPQSGAAVLAFEGDWTETQSEPIHAGDKVVVHYAPERLAQCAGSSNGHPAWGITAHWQVDDGRAHQLIVTRAEGTDLVASDPTLSVPNGRELTIWFEATSVWGCHVIDSDFGANYHAAIN